MDNTVPNLARYDFDGIRNELDERGFAVLPGLLTGPRCYEIGALYDVPERFRSRIVMKRHGFGEGEYQYFRYPLPPLIQDLRTALYPELAPLANRWAERMDWERRFPADHAAFLKVCQAAGQSRPTPLVLRYGPGDYNRLHQDLYGDIWFPLQVAVLLSVPDEEFAGGEVVLTEQKPRSQSRAAVVPLAQGDGLIFAVNDRPVLGTRGYYRVKMRHGVSDVRSGARHVLGLIFHDAA